MKKEPGLIFLILALVSLLFAMFFGTLAAFQFLYPDLLRDVAFFKTRPLHVGFAVAWIFLSAMGGIYYYLPKVLEIPLFSRRMVYVHAVLFFCTGATIAAHYFYGKFGGREYWEHPSWLGVPILISWILFGWNFFKSITKEKKPWPVYLWMWATGVVFFFLTFAEAHLWLLPYFRDNLVRDITVQWKAYGALVGSWNMLVYGTAIFLLEKIKGDTGIANSRLAFLMYFLGLTNLLFGWAHHLYTLPTAPYVRYLSYLVSMTEWMILGRILFHWRRSLDSFVKDFHLLPFRFLVASEIWIFLNLTLALLISIPAINIYTHGTHITVAHAMGSTIGINSMILLASVMYILSLLPGCSFDGVEKRRVQLGFWLAQCSLLVFWLALIAAGFNKGILIMEHRMSFQEIMKEIEPWLTVFACAGLGLFVGLLIVILPALEKLIDHFRNPLI